MICCDPPRKQKNIKTVLFPRMGVQSKRRLSFPSRLADIRSGPNLPFAISSTFKSFTLGHQTLYTLWIHAQYSTIIKKSDLRGLRIGKTCIQAIIARLVRCMHSQADSSWTSVLNLHRCGPAYRSSKSSSWRCFLDSIIALACHYNLLNFWECKAHRASSKLATF